MSLRVSCASLILATSCTLAAQPTCPQPNFLRPQPFNLLPSSTSLDVVRQPDGSYTGFEVAGTAPYRTIATTPHLEQQLAACLGHAIPTKPSLTSFNANPSGAGSQLQVSEALAGGGYFVAKLSSPDSTLILFDIFDAQHNLLSETSFTAPLTPPPFPASTEFFSLLLGDVNGDGIPDLLAVFEAPLALSIRNGGVWTFLGNGDGTFRTGIASVLTARGILAPAITAAVGDLNGDGKLDVVLAAPNSGPVLFATGNGDGTFNPADQVLYPLGPTTQATVTLADLNSDGKLDIVASGGSGVTVLLGNGDGTFQPPMVYAVLGPFGDLGDASYANVAVGDVNGDGHPDIVTSGGSILFGDGKGAFPTRRDYSLSMSAAGAASVMLADLDGDGNVDLIFGNGNPAFLSGNGTDPFLIVLFGTGGGKFTGAPMTTVPTGAEVAADFTGDGIPDLAIVTPSGIGYQVSVLPGVGDGTFQPASAVEGVLYGGTPHYAFTADFNRDGKADLAILTGALVVFLGKGDGTFGAPQSLAIPDFTVNYLVTADLNGDGFPDILAVGESNIYAFLGKGDGTFSPIAGSIAASNPALAVGDFNGDGKPDLAFANKGASALNVLPGKGDGTFGTAIVTTLPAPALGEQTNIAAADFDGDGRLDIALTLDTEVAVFPGRGDGTFGSPRLTPGFLADLTAIDLNDDGVIDLVGDNGGSEVAGCLGNGDGTFQPCARISVTLRPLSGGRFQSRRPSRCSRICGHRPHHLPEFFTAPSAADCCVRRQFPRRSVSHLDLSQRRLGRSCR